MPDTNKNNVRKRKLLRRVRRQRLKYITILPSLITLINGICGFAAISFASEGMAHFSFHKVDLPFFSWAGYMIFFAMIADMLDGRVARMSHTTSSFGGQLDSLCDMISFGVAPAFLMLKLMEHKLSALVEPSTIFSDFLTRLIGVAAAVYVACTAIRLARFNVENEEDETAHMSFMGLPAPAAAGVIASLIVFYEDIFSPYESSSMTVQICSKAILFSLPFISIGIAILMISRIRYPHLVNQYLRGRKPWTHLWWTIAIFILIGVFKIEGGLVISFCGFALTGFCRWFYRKVIRKLPAEEINDPPILTVSGPPGPSN